MKRCRQRGQGAGQPEVLKCLGAERANDAPDVLGSAARGLAQLVELLAKLVGDPRGEALDLEHDARERLADLVVQLARHPLPLALLDHEGPSGALALLRFQPVEHLVEGVGECRDLGAALDVDALAGRQRVMPAHVVRQLVEGAERRAHEHKADRERESHAAASRLTDSVRVKGSGRIQRPEDEPEDHDDEHGGVAPEHAPEQRPRRKRLAHQSRLARRARGHRDPTSRASRATRYCDRYRPASFAGGYQSGAVAIAPSPSPPATAFRR